MTKKSAEKPKINKQFPSLHVPDKHAGFWQVFWYKLTLWSLRHKFWKRFAITFAALIILLTGSMYGVAQWYIQSQKDKPYNVGATFIADYARHFDLDPKVTLETMLQEMRFKRLRLVSYWEVHEHDQGMYNFDELDWQFEMAEKYGATVSLAIGLRQPRWPECHMPDWASKMTGTSWRQPLYKYMETVVNRYKNHPMLESYQLENEFFLSVFGICTDFDRERLKHEYDLVKRLDPATPLIVNRSNNATPSWPIGEPRADEVGAAIYKRVYDKTITQRYFEYPLPAWYYGFLAGMTKLTTNRDTFIHELQTEPWVDDKFGGIKGSTIEEQFKTMSPDRLVDRISYAKATGMKTFDLWGIEWMLWLKTHRGESSVWDTMVSELNKIEQENQQLK